MDLEQASNAVANAAFDISAIKLKPHDPFPWASGTFNPIYNDNRTHLRYPGNRALITKGLELVVQDAGISIGDIDVITGTSTSGIAPAASLAYLLGVDNVSILIDGEPHVYNLIDAFQLMDDVHEGAVERADVIVSTCPSSLIPAVLLADLAGKPFAYVREKQKGHGLKQQIEGRLYDGEEVMVCNWHHGESYLRSAVEYLKTRVDVLGVEVRKFEPREFDFDGARTLHVEDLISTAGSCTKEIKTYQERGANVLMCAAIFSYDLPKGLQRFVDVNTKLGALLHYDRMLDVAIARGEVSEDDRAMLAEWRKDQANWGANHGFAPYK